MELQPIDHSDGSSARRGAALKIYKKQILPEAQNPEKQILYWIEHSKERMSDQFHCLSITDEKKTVGYLQFSYFVQKRILFFEYLCVVPKPKSGLAPSAAIKEISEYVHVNFPSDVKIVFEIAYKKNAEGAWTKDEKTVSYFKRIGFRTVDFTYEYPVLQSYGDQVSYPADLMIKLPTEGTTLTASDLRGILRCIYFNHYLNWDRPFLNHATFAAREAFIDRLYSKRVEEISDGIDISTHGGRGKFVIRSVFGKPPRIKPLFNHVFGPKLPRLCVVGTIIVCLERILGSVWLLIPFVLASSAVYCLAEDTTASKKLFTAIISRLTIAKPKSS